MSTENHDPSATQAAPEATPLEQAVPQAPAKRRHTGNEVFAYTGKPLEDKDSAGKALHEAPLLWLTVLIANGGSMSRDLCAAALSEKMDGLKTTQSVDRLLYYWKKYLALNGWITVTKNGKAVVFTEKKKEAPAEAAPTAETVGEPATEAAPATSSESTEAAESAPATSSEGTEPAQAST